MSVSIGFTGDFCPWKRTQARFESGDWEEDFASVKALLQENDFNIADLECPLTLPTQPIAKTGPHLCADPATAAILPELGIQLVVTANNHFYDYGYSGMKSSYQALTDNGVSWLGSGANFEEAATTHYQEIDGLLFGIINVAENEWSTTKGKQAGTHPLDPVANYQNIQEANKRADYVIIIVHGGHEHYPLPSPRIQQLYRFFIDAGAAAVVSHHPHIVSGYEVYKDAPIFYSLGNFCFDDDNLRDNTWNIGMVARLIFKRGEKVAFSYKFVEQNNHDSGVKVLTGAAEKEQEERIQQLNQVIADEHALADEFNQYCAKLQDVLLTWIEPYRGKYLAGAYKKGILPSLLGRNKKLLINNLIRCEAHRDVLLQALKNDLA